MILLTGLGNPGEKFKNNRHNIGFMIADQIAKHYFSQPFRSKFFGDFSEGKVHDDRVLLLKPATFMNNSGQSVMAAMNYFRLSSEQVIVFHDELDLESGKIRLKRGGGHGGHNGLRSVHAHIGEGYKRVRLGIGHPGIKNEVSNYVLQDFAKEDQKWLSVLISSISSELKLLLTGNEPEFMNRISLAVEPFRSSRLKL